MPGVSLLTNIAVIVEYTNFESTLTNRISKQPPESVPFKEIVTFGILIYSFIIAYENIILVEMSCTMSAKEPTVLNGGDFTYT